MDEDGVKKALEEIKGRCLFMKILVPIPSTANHAIKHSSAYCLAGSLRSWESPSMNWSENWVFHAPLNWRPTKILWVLAQSLSGLGRDCDLPCIAIRTEARIAFALPWRIVIS